MRILVTGSRDWKDSWVVIMALRDVLGGHPKGTIVEGGGQGADRIARNWARRFPDLTVETHKAEWRTQGSAAGPIRNQKMVDLGADICLAFPLGESPGTRDCMRRARKAGVTVMDYGDQS